MLLDLISICNLHIFYRLNTDGKDSSFYAYWTQSSGIFKKVSENNMDDSSYIHVRKERLKKVIENANQAYFGQLKTIDNDMVCEVCF